MLSRLAAPATTLVLLALGACSAGLTAEEPSGSSDSIEVPEVGACRALTPEDVTRPDNASAVVDCAEEHTAETFTVGTFPGGLAVGDDIDDPDLGAYIYDTCNKRFQAFLGGDESLVHAVDAHLGLVPALAGGLGQGRALVPLRRGRRR